MDAQSDFAQGAEGDEMANTLVRWRRSAVTATPFEPDVLTGPQWADLLASSHRSGELRLCAAILADAILVYQKSVYIKNREASRLHAEVDDWFASDDLTYVHAFAAICLVLGLDPDYVRRGLRRWRASGEPARRKSPAHSGRPSSVVALRRVRG